MVWNEVGVWTITDFETLLLVSFTSRLAIKVSEIAGYRPTWNWAGFFYQYLDITPIGLTRIDKKINVPIIEPVLFIPNIFQPNYQLKFIKADWINSLILTIYEDSMPLNFEPFVNVPTNFASTATSVTVPISATSVSLLAANANRKKLVIANNTNQDLYIDLDATASVADHAIKIPRVSTSGFIATYELEQYTGVVSGIWGAAGTGAALIREMV
ncbi:MAG: hypothetical protein ACRCZI_13710 [Cetobacterium sp.]